VVASFLARSPTKMDYSRALRNLPLSHLIILETPHPGFSRLYLLSKSRPPSTMITLRGKVSEDATRVFKRLYSDSLDCDVSLDTDSFPVKRWIFDPRSCTEGRRYMRDIIESTMKEGTR
jgi:hypothetical protein